MNAAKTGGFSLLEMAVVLLVLGLLLGGILQPWGVVMEQKKRAETRQKLQHIQESLYAHAVVYGRLPCPDCRTDSDGRCRADMINDGMEDVRGNACASAVGNLPWSTLAVPRGDAWGQDYSYRVSPAFARPLTACQDRPPCRCKAMQAAFTLCDEARLAIGDAPDGADNVGRNLPAVVVSHGRNRLAERQGDGELDNYEGLLRHPQTGRRIAGPAGQGRRFVARSPHYRDGAEEFDDLLIWLSPFVLKTRMVQAGRLP